MTRLIPQNQLAGQHDQVLDSHQAVADLRQALSYPYDLQGFDDLLSAIGANRSNYMQAANQQKLINAVSNGDWRAVKYLKAGGYVGIGLAMGAAAMRVDEACRSGSKDECSQARFVEGGKLAGSISGGVAAGYVASSALKYGVCAAIGVETLGVGGIVCALLVSGAVASATGTKGSEIGGEIGEKLYELTQP